MGTPHTNHRYRYYHATELLKAKIYMWSAKVTTGLPDDDIAGDHIATLTAVDPNNSDLLTAKKASDLLISS